VSFLPGTPKVEVDVVADRSSEREGFLTLKRYELVVVDANARRSSPFRYDLIERRSLDAAVMAAHYIGADGKPHVYLRTAIRPPILLSRPKGLRNDVPSSSVLWELPAGLIEPGEEPRAAAARELEEELGFSVATTQMLPLGPTTYPAPGFIGEMHWFFHATVDPDARKEPRGDGSPLEDLAQIIAVPIDVALAACHAGEIRDAKTELALYRLHAALA
jgi:ADP-ribose pyrophosphatase